MVAVQLYMVAQHRRDLRTKFPNCATDEEAKGGERERRDECR